MPRRMHRNPSASVVIDAPLGTVWAVMTEPKAHDPGLCLRGVAGPARVEEGFSRHAAALKQRAEELRRRSG